MLRDDNSGATNMPSEIVGEATEESMGTDLRRTDDESEVVPSGGPTEEGVSMTPDDVDLAGHTFQIDTPSGEPSSSRD